MVNNDVLPEIDEPKKGMQYPAHRTSSKQEFVLNSGLRILHYKAMTRGIINALNHPEIGRK